VRGHHRIPVIRLVDSTCPGPGGPVTAALPNIRDTSRNDNKICHVIGDREGHGRTDWSLPAPSCSGTAAWLPESGLT
jgi:hypothetical protein